MHRRKLDWKKIRADVEASAAKNPGLIGPFLPPTKSPPWRRYVFDRPFPERLNFRDVEVVLELVTPCDDWSALQARKLTPAGETVALCTEPHGRLLLDASLYRTGFSLQDGTPAARLMDCLVRLSYAHVMPLRDAR